MEPTVAVSLPPTAKHSAISLALRQAILRGELRPGDRLPYRRELESTFGVTNMTVQRAIDLLKQGGFIRSRGRWGVHVVDRPPCLHRFALALPHGQHASHCSLFTRALLEVATREEGWGADSFVVYPNVIPAPGGQATSEGYRRLLRDLRELRLAGVVFTNTVFPFGGDPVVSEGELPRVALASSPWRRVGAVAMDRLALWRLALEHLVGRGCRRLAFIVAGSDQHHDLDFARSWLAERGLPLADELVLGLQPNHPHWARNAVLLFCALPEELRPDGLFVADDHLLPAVRDGLLAARSRGCHLELAAHANFPLAQPNVSPVARFGFDAREVLAAALAALREQGAGQGPVRRLVPPRAATVADDEALSLEPAVAMSAAT